MALNPVFFSNGLPLIAWNAWLQADDVTYNPTTWMNMTQDYTNGFIDIVRFNGSYISTSPNAPDDILPTILRCGFTWCAQYHGTSSFYNGMLHDVPEFSVPLIQGEYSLVPDSANIPQDELQKIKKLNQEFQVDKDFDDTFQLLLGSILTIEIFNATYELFDLGNLLEDIPSAFRSDYEAPIFNNAAWKANEGKSYSVYYGNNGNISATLDNIAVSVTNQIRSSFDSSNVTGTVMYPIVYIEVIWPWFIYPITLTLLAVVLLFVTIWLSCGYEKMVWKSSSLALLFHGMPVEEADGRLLSTAAMDAAADEMWAKLSKDEAGNIRLKML